ncbi:hypothetical protein ACFYV7_15035 [Nocardia suismassiliense]|uniref:Lysophospholipase L1 or related esterase n=1 Tax=Nocardia suismassiliense TaxID=2077092 RepID=A0ABW6QU10_9NOCA
MGLDGIVIAAGSNDIQGGRTLAQMQADVITAINKNQHRNR